MLIAAVQEAQAAALRELRDRRAHASLSRDGQADLCEDDQQDSPEGQATAHDEVRALVAGKGSALVATAKLHGPDCSPTGEGAEAIRQVQPLAVNDKDEEQGAK